MQGVLPMMVARRRAGVGGRQVGSAPATSWARSSTCTGTIYVDEELGDPILQQEAAGRDTSFAQFAAGDIGILLESDYFWRSVINPAEGVGTAPMENRDEVVGYARIPAMEPGVGVNGQDFVSMSGGTGRVLNPGSDEPGARVGAARVHELRRGVRVAGGRHREHHAARRRQPDRAGRRPDALLHQ